MATYSRETTPDTKPPNWENGKLHGERARKCVEEASYGSRDKDRFNITRCKETDTGGNPADIDARTRTNGNGHTVTPMMQKGWPARN